MLTVGSLFSGIGGLDLGLERAGMNVIWQSEIEPYACRVLAKHWPDVPNLGDITTIDWSSVERPDVICGGYPCQPFSLVGERGGESDPRHLWPYFARAIRVLRPRYAVLENVPGHLSLGFGRVLGDLAELGFAAWWDSIPAAAVGAPHLRYRVFVVAYSGGEGRREDTRGALGDEASDEGRGTQHDHVLGGDGESGRAWSAADTDSEQVGRLAVARGERGQWAVEPDVGRVADGVPSRVDRLRALGNAVVPQVAEFVGRRIVAAEAGRVAA